MTTRSNLLLSSLGSRRNPYSRNQTTFYPTPSEDHPEFMQYLKEVVNGIKSLKNWEKAVEHKVGLALGTLSHGQQLAVSVLQQLYTEV
jgi:hypothetical protein